jgi:hypothetical protein
MARGDRVVYTRADGGLTIFNLAWGSGPSRMGMTDDEFLSHVIEKDVLGRADGQGPADGKTYRVISDSDMPTGDARKFMDAWEDTGTVVQVNLPKARVIHMDRIRAVRNAELAKEDVTFMRAVEAGDTDAQATIATEKQVLRDIPATFDITTGVTTPELLQAKWPSELPARE